VSKLGSGFSENIKLVYQSYGGPMSILCSAYFWCAVFLTALSSRFALEYSWAEKTLNIMPSLAGFSIAAFAIYFAVIDPALQQALLKPAEELGGRSPLLVLASTVVHAVFVQMSAMIYAFVFISNPLTFFASLFDFCDARLALVDFYHWASIAASFLGLFISIYGLVLVLGATLSMFRIISIKVKVGS
jgi:hypothetical protein